MKYIFVIFLDEDWDYPPIGYGRRPMVRALARYLQTVEGGVLCLDRPLCPIVTSLTDRKKLKERIAGYKKHLRKIDTNLFLYTPWAFLHERLAPFFPGITALNIRLLRRQIRDCIDQLEWNRAKLILWILHPYHRDMLKTFEQSVKVYECYDDYYSYGRRERLSGIIMARCEADVLKRADIVITTARNLYDERISQNPNTYLMPNGVEYALFSSKAVPGGFQEPKDLASIPRPRVGHTGATSNSIDFDLLCQCAERLKNASFLFIGPNSWVETLGIPESYHQFCSYPNVFFLGSRPYEQIPRYMRACDVLLMPYGKHSGTASKYPYKVNEYLATGRPVVSTRFSVDMEDFKDVIYMTDTSEEFCAMIETALKHPDSNRLYLGQKLAESNSWLRRAERVWEIIQARAQGV